MLGIGVLVYNRFSGAFGCIESINRFTSTEHKLIIADDGSSDGFSEHAKKRGWTVKCGENRGVAWNYNRALWTLKDCDPIILMECDVSPNVFGWEKPWLEAANVWGHVNYAYISPPPIFGIGTSDSPYRTEFFGSQVVATSQAAFQKVGYQDPRFYPLKYSNAHAEWTFRFERALNWNKCTKNSTPPCLRHGIKEFNFGSYYNETSLKESFIILSQTINDSDYRLPWRNDKEQKTFLDELQ